MAVPESGLRGRRVTGLAVLTALAWGAMIVLLKGWFALVGPAVLGALALFFLVRSLTSEPDRQPEYRRILRWTMWSFVAHLVLGLLITNAGGPFHAIQAPDWASYHGLAQDQVRHWTSGMPAPALPAGKEGFYYVLSGLYWVFGTHPAAGLAVNAALAAALVPLLGDTTRRLFDDRAAAFTAPLAVLVPGLLLWPSQLLKEAAVLFLIVVAVNCAARLTDRMGVGALSCLAGSLGLLFSFRAWVALMVAAGLVSGVALGRDRLMSGVGTGLSGLTVLTMVMALGLGYSGYRTAVGSDLGKASAVHQELASTNSGFDVGVDISTTKGALSYLPRGLANFLLGPFPWQIRGSRQLPVLPDVAVWWALLPALWVGLRTARPLANRRALVLVLPAATTSVLLGLSVGNFGTVVRERMQVVVVLVPLLALGLSVLSERRGRAPRVEEPVPAV